MSSGAALTSREVGRKRGRSDNSWPSGHVEGPRTVSACNSCHSRKIKCSGDQPCRYCCKKQLECVFPMNRKKRLYSVAYVEELEAKAAARAEPSSQSITSDDPAASVTRHTTEPYKDHAELSVPRPVPSSSLRFGQEIKQLGMSTSPATIPSNDDQATTQTFEDVYALTVPNVGFQLSPDLLPNYDEAHDLLDTVLQSLGQIHHLFDPRTFSDHLHGAYHENGHLGTDVHDIWYLQFLMVVAIGKLLQGVPLEPGVLPGSDFYLEARRRLPDFVALRGHGVLALEILSMMTFFLQCADLRDDAYISASIALRLAMVNGLRLTAVARGSKRSVQTHRVRLWWTIYMQERRLAAATGQPLSLHDNSIETHLPTDAPGFASPTALNINIRLARITGQIMQTVYVDMSKSTFSHESGVKKVLQELLQISNGLPQEFMVDFAADRLTFTRTSATLCLTLNQCIILATRPTLLHLARLRHRAASGVEGPQPDIISGLESLSDACIQAASRCLRLLQAMQEQSIIANFGFFDLDATFSSAFVFVLVRSIYPDHGGTLAASPIGKASSILRYLSSKGNQAAVRRLAEIRVTTQHLGLPFSMPLSQGDSHEVVDGTSSALTIAEQGDQGIIDVGNVASLAGGWNCEASSSTAMPANPLPSSPPFQNSQSSAGILNHQQSGPTATNGPGDERAWHMNNLYLEEFSLTGILEVDWAELAKQLASSRNSEEPSGEL